MTGLVFALSMVLILTAVGSLFSWMVHLASVSEASSKPVEAKPLQA